MSKNKTLHIDYSDPLNTEAGLDVKLEKFLAKHGWKKGGGGFDVGKHLIKMWFYKKDSPLRVSPNQGDLLKGIPF